MLLACFEVRLWKFSKKKKKLIFFSMFLDLSTIRSGANEYECVDRCVTGNVFAACISASNRIIA